MYERRSAHGVQRNKQPGRQQAEAHGQLPRKSKVRAAQGRNGDLWLSLPDERGHEVISLEDLS